MLFFFFYFCRAHHHRYDLISVEVCANFDHRQNERKKVEVNIVFRLDNIRANFGYLPVLVQPTSESISIQSEMIHRERERHREKIDLFLFFYQQSLPSQTTTKRLYNYLLSKETSVQHKRNYELFIHQVERERVRQKSLLI